VQFLGRYGTIGSMKDHRVRLTDEDIQLIVAALRARHAMTRGARNHRVVRLAERLAEMAPGNPKWTISEMTQMHEDDVDAEWFTDQEV
jgi:hypothetical protein